MNGNYVMKNTGMPLFYPNLLGLIFGSWGLHKSTNWSTVGYCNNELSKGYGTLASPTWCVRVRAAPTKFILLFYQNWHSIVASWRYVTQLHDCNRLRMNSNDTGWLRAYSISDTELKPEHRSSWIFFETKGRYLSTTRDWEWPNNRKFLRMTIVENGPHLKIISDYTSHI